MTATKWPVPGDRDRYTIGMALGIAVAMALCLCLPGLVVGIVGHVGLRWAAEAIRRRRGRRRVRAAYAAGADAWTADWRGPREELRNRVLSRPIPRWIFWPGTLVAGGALFPVPFAARQNAGAVAFLLGVAGTSFVAMLVWVVFRGGFQVRPDAFTLRVGTSVRFWVATLDGSPPLETPRVLLRCVYGRTVVWSSEREVTPGPDEFVECVFDVPPNIAGTSLHAAPFTRWELLVAGRTRWGRLVETFVVPVYGPAPYVPAVAGPQP